MTDFWELVESDPRNHWDRNQKVLFWWIVTWLQKMEGAGVIAAPDPSPLTDEQILEVYDAVLPQQGNQRSYLDETWTYHDQSLMFPSEEGNMVQVQQGKAKVVPMPNERNHE